MKKITITILLTGLIPTLQAQESSSVFNFMKIPISSHAAALGGPNISLIDDDPTLTLNNPALLASVSDKTINLNYMTYLKGTQAASATFVKILGDRHTLGIGARFISYGDMDETDETGQILGDLSAKDIAVSGLYSYTLSEKWAGGATMHFLYSKYAEYNSTAIAFDLGLNYFDEDTRDFVIPNADVTDDMNCFNAMKSLGHIRRQKREDDGFGTMMKKLQQLLIAYVPLAR